MDTTGGFFRERAREGLGVGAVSDQRSLMRAEPTVVILKCRFDDGNERRKKEQIASSRLGKIAGLRETHCLLSIPRGFMRVYGLVFLHALQIKHWNL